MSGDFFRGRKGFTLIELLLVIGLLGILASLVIVAISPERNIDEAQDVTRKQQLRVMLDALYQYQIDSNEFPTTEGGYATIDSTPRDICSAIDIGPDIFFCEFDAPRRVPLVPLIPDYLSELPHDPENTVEHETGYQLWLDENGRLNARAPLGKDGEGITLTR